MITTCHATMDRACHRDPGPGKGRGGFRFATPVLPLPVKFNLAEGIPGR
jgi:hypothetical protein